MTALSRLPRPGGITIDVTIPQWLVLLVRLSIGLVVLAILGLLVVAVAASIVSDRGGGDGASTSSTLTDARGNFGARPLQDTVTLTVGSEPADDLHEEWTLLLSSGAVHWANIVEGPERLAPGETGTFVLTFLFEPQEREGDPVALRWDPRRRINASILLGGP